MKIKYTLKSFAVSSMCMLLLSGCDLFTKSGVSGAEGRVVTLSDGRKVVVSGQKQADGTIITSNQTSQKADKAKPAAKSDKKLTPPKDTSKKDSKKKDKNKKNSKTADSVSLNDRETITDSKPISRSPEAAVEQVTGVVDSLEVVEAVADEIAVADTAAVPAINGEWTIYSVRNNLVTGEERPYVNLDFAANRFYGNNGCNYINGDLSVYGSNVKFTNMISTLKMCSDDQFQYLINLALNDVETYAVRQESPITFLDLKDASGRVVLVLRRHNMDFLNGAWTVTELNGTALEQDDEATMTFDTTDLKIHGTTGCNIFNGELFIDPDKINSLQIIKLITTRMSCPNITRETEFLLALESVETACQISGGSVVLYDTENNPIFKLEKMDLREADE
jgi:heat shock protein HslJ